MTRPTRAIVATALLVLLVAASRVHATVEAPVEFGEMVRGSQLVVHGRVANVQSRQTGDRRSIDTVVTVAVATAFKGQPGAEVTFRLPGGEVGRYRRVIVGVPRLAAGDEVVLFLRGAAPSLPTIFGLNQGLFRVARIRDGQPLVGPAPLAAPATGAERVVRGDPARQALALDAFAREVRARLEVRP